MRASLCIIILIYCNSILSYIYYKIIHRNLTYLSLYGNELTGMVPPEIGDLTNLTYFLLSNNQLTGEIPSEIGNLMNLMKLYLHNNFFEQEIPQNLCELNIDWSNDSYFSIYNNQLCPPYPECIEEFIGYQDNYECGECSFYLGDINDDLTLNVVDIVLVVLCVLSGTCNHCSDFNQDGSTDILDIIGVTNVILDN